MYPVDLAAVEIMKVTEPCGAFCGFVIPSDPVISFRSGYFDVCWLGSVVAPDPALLVLLH